MIAYTRVLVNVLMAQILTLLFCSTNWFIMWVCVEVITICLVILIQSSVVPPRESEAISKYFITQSIAGIILLAGIMFRSSVSGVLLVEGVYQDISVVLILLGLLIKLGAFPNYYWFVDVVAGLSFTRVFYVIVVSKIAPLYLFFVLVNGNYGVWCLLVGSVTLLVGSLLGINQVNLRKIVAYSSITAIGMFVLCWSYLTAYVAISVFIGYMVGIMPLVLLSSVFNLSSSRKSSNLYHNEFVVLALIISLLSLGGIPPLVGFFVKWALLKALVDFGVFWACMVLVLGSLLSLYFYLFVVYYLYLIIWPEIKVTIIGINFFLSLSLTSILGVCISIILFSVFIAFPLLWVFY